MTRASRSMRGSRSLAGTWQLVAADGRVRRVAVPACWEDAGIALDVPGPFTYRRVVRVPRRRPGDRVWLRFDAVSYACRVRVAGHDVGGHVGAWDPFLLEITEAVGDADQVAIEVEVEKPASLTGGPDSPAVPGRHPLRETLSGFLPYVWGHMFGGIWQDVTLVTTGPVAIGHAYVSGQPEGEVAVEVSLTDASELDVTLLDPAGRVVEQVRAAAATRHEVRLVVPAPRPWSPEDPACYMVQLRIPDGDERTFRFGLRRVGTEDTRVTLNGNPVFPRMVLSWGWYPERLTPAPDPARVRADLEQLRRLGFNGVKLCLWVPPEAYLDVCDELGMLVWLELPMWLPRPSLAFRAQVGVEYERIVRVARQHPSVVMYSLGCELNSDVADLLGPLYDRVKSLVGDALVRDNSGSGEAYGGRLDESADYHDHHPYAELQHLPDLLDHFAPRWRPVRPWLFGEFADSDAFRDPRALPHERDGPPWWTSDDPRRNPQGARWAMEVTGFPSAIDAAGYGARGEELRRISDQASLLLRRRVFETVRGRADVSGYVLTGERDTPISTSGVWDDTGRLRLAEDALRDANDDLVLTLGRDRRRAWLSGGDRPARSDPWTHRAGSPMRAYLVLSHFGRAPGRAEVSWSLGRGDGRSPVASGTSRTDLAMTPGEVREVGVIDIEAPAVDVPTAFLLRASATVAGQETRNEWPLWVFPEPPWPDGATVGVIDPAGTLADLVGLLGTRCVEPERATVIVASRWTARAQALVEAGGRLVLLQPDADGPFDVEPLPYWREAIRVAEGHRAWGDFPVLPFLGLQVAAVAADHAFVVPPDQGRQPIMRRVDARSGRHHDYAFEGPFGRGRLIATTLRLTGGAGDLPRGLARSPGALHLLACWVRHLAG